MNPNLRESIRHGTKEYPYSQHYIQGVPYGFHFPVHWHDEMEIIWVRKGVLMVNVGGEDYPLHAGTVLIVNPRQLHLMWAEDTNVCYHTLIFPVELISFQSDDLLEETVFQPLRTGRYTLLNKVPESILTAENLALLEQTVLINKQKSTMYQLETRLLLLRFLMEILNQTELSENKEDRTGQMHRQLLEYIRIHYKSKITLSELSEQFHLSPKYLSRYFKEQFHLTISEYIRHLRMEYAEELLENTDLPVTEIAEQAGFSSVSFFIRQFTKDHGCSPRKWRQGNKDV